MRRVWEGTESTESESRPGDAMLRKLIGLAYLVAGLIVANAHHYFKGLDGFKPILSAVLAVLLWPLVLFGVSLHIK
jgi:hypothetical protein